jgi:hypothetical protein
VIGRPEYNEDFADLLSALADADVEFLVVDAHALAVHGVVRASGDLDVFVRPVEENATRVTQALLAFGAPLAAHRVAEADFARPDTVYQLGLPPRRIDVMTSLSGVTFDEACADSVRVRVGGVDFRVPGIRALIANKRAVGRPRDLEDVRALEALLART